MTSPRRHPLIWLALLAMLAVALLPTVSHALAQARSGAAVWAEVCTPQGLRSVGVASATAGRDAAPMQGAASLDHCPLCTLSASHPGLAPAAACCVLRLSFDGVRLPRDAPALHALPACSIAQPRGPPAGA